MIKDSGERTEYENGFVRDMHEGKGRFDLMPWRAIWELAKHCEEGAKKYGERNIDLGCPQHSLIDSAIRHLAKYLMGFDDEKHLRAAFWNVGWALEQEVFRPDMQDIPARKGINENDELKSSGWISVKDYLPPMPKHYTDGYIVQKENVEEPFSAYWDGESWFDRDDDPIEIIAWQPLPERYKR